MTIEEALKILFEHVTEGEVHFVIGRLKHRGVDPATCDQILKLIETTYTLKT